MTIIIAQGLPEKPKAGPRQSGDKDCKMTGELVSRSTNRTDKYGGLVVVCFLSSGQLRGLTVVSSELQLEYLADGCAEQA